MPAPFGLDPVRCAPDHPRIKGIINALHKVLDKPQVRLLGNVDYGTDINRDDLARHYDAAIFSTGAVDDRDLEIPASSSTAATAPASSWPGTTGTLTSLAPGRWRPRRSP